MWTKMQIHGLPVVKYSGAEKIDKKGEEKHKDEK